MAFLAQGSDLAASDRFSPIKASAFVSHWKVRLSLTVVSNRTPFFSSISEAVPQYCCSPASFHSFLLGDPLTCRMLCQHLPSNGNKLHVSCVLCLHVSLYISWAVVSWLLALSIGRLASFVTGCAGRAGNCWVKDQKRISSVDGRSLHAVFTTWGSSQSEHALLQYCCCNICQPGRSFK